MGAVSPVAAAPVTIEVRAGQPGAAISPLHYGVFFEDINFGADGGLSAELVKNGSFEFDDRITGWGKIEPAGSVGGIGFRSEQPRFANNPTYARVTALSAGRGFGLRNEGYRGIGVRAGARYRFSAAVRLVDGAPRTLRVELHDRRRQAIGATTVQLSSREWTTVEAEITPTATESGGSLTMLVDAPGVFDLDAVSLMPVDTWKDRRNGLRPDLVQLLADLQPGFIRFPGGCIVEGRALPLRYQWKNTIGPVEERPVLINRWNVEFAGRGRGAYDYYQSFRVGFFEYFLLCADLGAEPVPIVNCGMACQYNSGECVPLDELGPYVQDALDLIEFANGPVTSEWGRRRAEMGQPEPFGLKLLGIGNEQWGPQYFERYARFAEAIRAKYPDIQLITSSGPQAEDARYTFAWEQIRSMAAPADVVDEHCYARPEWFLDNSRRYDAYPRTGPRVFMGEYAAHPEGVASAASRNIWAGAIAEAAFMVGMERNADIVTMTAYAPLLAHVDAWQWTPDLIWFDNFRAYGTPSYHVQKLFSLERGDVVLPLQVDGAPQADNGQPRFYVCASRDDAAAGEIVLKVVNATGRPVEATIELAGVSAVTGPARLIVLGSDDAKAENSLDHPELVAPVATTIELPGPAFTHTFPASRVVVLRVPVRSQSASSR